MMDADPPLPPSRSSDDIDTSTSTSTSVALSPLTFYKLYLCTPTQLLSLRLPALKPTFARTALKSDAKSKAAQSAAQLQNQAAGSLPRTLRIRDCRGHGSPQRAIQRIALGHVNNHRLLALARRDGTIDLVALTSGADQEDTTLGKAKEQENVAEPNRLNRVAGEQEDPVTDEARAVATIKEDRMRPGMERWLAISFSQHYIYGITSAGSLRRTELLIEGGVESVEDGPSTSAGSSKARQADGPVGSEPTWSLGESASLDLPAPLQSAAFHPSQNPTHLLIGGEQQALSLWELKAAFDPAAESDASLAEMEHNASNGSFVAETADGGMSAKERKRKRQADTRAKARELLPGEIWRAKPLPNDALSLPQHPRITSVCLLSQPARSSVRPHAAEAAAPSAPTRFVAGTRDGLLRFYDTRGGARKANKEMRVVPVGQGAVRLLVASSPDAVQASQMSEPLGIDEHPRADENGQTPGPRHWLQSASEVFVADQSGKLYAVDVEQPSIKYSYPDINGAISSALSIPAPRQASSSSKSRGTPRQRVRPESEQSEADAQEQSPLLLTCSQDRLVRLHSTSPATAISVRQSEGTGVKEDVSKSQRAKVSSHTRGKTLCSVFAASGDEGPIGVVWDGVLPVQMPELVEDARRVRQKGRTRDGEEQEEEEEGHEMGSRTQEEEQEDQEEEEQVWRGLGTVGREQLHGTVGKESEEQQDKRHDDDAVDVARSKRVKV